MINDGGSPASNPSPYCPITGLPITRKPEWTDLCLDSDFYVTFSIIGNAILLTTARGNPTYKGIKHLFVKISEIIHEAGLSGKKYVELKDYTMLTNIPPRTVRMAWSDYMLKEAAKGYLQGVWVFGASLFLRLIFQAGQKMYNPPIPVSAVNAYPEAIRGALKNLRQKGVDVGTNLQHGFTKDGWTLEIEGYGISFELIGDDVLYTIAHGSLKEPDVEKFFRLHDKVLDEAGLYEKGYFYRIINWERYERSNWQVRRMYIQGMKDLSQRIDCKLSVVFGLNPFMKALAEVSKPFMPTAVMLANDFQEALAMVDQAREREFGARSSGKRLRLKEKSYTEAQVKGFSEEMLQVLGELNWEKIGLSVDGISEEHPLKPVFDALAVIKLDLDELLREKEKSQRSIQESEEKYRGILESITDSYFETDLRGNMVFCNPILPKDLGYTQEEILGMNFRSYTDPETAEGMKEIFRKAYRDDTPASVVRYEVTRRDGTKIPVETMFSLIRDRDGKVIGFRGTSRDITERKRAEEALQESEKRFTSIFNAQQNGIIIIDPETHRIVDINAAALHMIGATREDAVGRQCYRYICPTERGRCPITDMQMDIDHAERLLVRADKTRISIIKSVSRMTLGGKELLIESIIDISDRKKAEDALKESEGKYRTLFENADDAILLMDGDCFIDCNKKTPQMFGCTREQIIGQSPFFFSPPLQPDGSDSREKALEKIRLAFSGQEQFFEWQHIKQDGTPFDAEISLNIVRLDNQNYLQSIVRDISDRKQAEEALRRKTALLEAQVNTSIDGILVVDGNNKRIITNRRLIDLWGVPQHIVDNEDDTALLQYVVSLTRDPDQFIAKVKHLYDHPYETGHDEVEFKNGAVLERYSAPVLDADGRHYGRIWTFHDITERKEAEDALKESEERYRNILESIEDGYSEVDLAGNFNFFNPSMCKILGYSEEEMLGVNYRKFMDKVDAKAVFKAFKEMYVNGIPNRSLEWDIIRKDGTRRHLEASVSLMTGPDGHPNGFQGIARDVSERKTAENALKESEEKYRNILESIEDGYFEVDLTGSFLFFNASMCAILGFTPEEMPGMNYTKYMDEASIKVVYKSFIEIYKTRIASKGFEWNIIRKDGAVRHLEVSVSLIMGPDGNAYGFRGIARDITKRRQAQDALRESEEKYRNILESMEDGYFEVDLTGNFLFYNPSLCTFLGYSREELANVNYGKILDDCNRKRMFEAFNKVYKTGVSMRGLEWEITQKNDDRRYLEGSVSLMKDAGGRPTGFRGLARDISARKKAENALRESEEKYRNILESIEDGYFEVDLAGNFTFFNPSICKIYGYSAEEMFGMSYRVYTDDIDAKRVFAAFNKVYETGIPSKGFEWNIIRKDGTRRQLEMSASLITDGGSGAIGFRGIARDISERKIIERELEKHRDHLEEMIKERTTELMRTSNFLSNIINSSIDGIITTDIEGTILHASPRIHDILGYEQDEVMGKKVHTLFAGGYEESEKMMDELMKKGEIRGYELKSTKKNGESIILNLSMSLLRDEKGDITGTTSIYRDITEEKRMKEAMKQAMLRAESASKAKSQFLANMSHEIRTPLNGILGMSDLCLETELNQEQRHLVDTISKEAHSLLGIVNEILEFEKIGAGKVELEQIPFDLRNLLEDMATTSSYRTAQKGLAFTSYLAPDVPTRLMGDPGRVRQIMRNLIDNAVKFTPEGGIDVEADLAEDLGDRIRVRFQVKDTGIGIPKEKQSLVFESFTQADGSTTRKYGGTGLGITISKQLAELMSGTLGLESEVGRGSTFWFTAVFSKQSETDSPRRTDVPLNHVKVLVVDGNPTSRRTFVEYLMSWGSAPVEAASAKEALSILKGATAGGKRFNLVLSNLNMPEMNGFDLARAIKDMESVCSIPIILFTSSGNPGDGKTCRDMGIAGYLTKPIKESDLRRAVEIVLDDSMREERIGKIDLVTRHSSAEINRRDFRILLAEDYPTNQEIAKRHLEHAGYAVDLAADGKRALEAFKRGRYDLILMDIQMPVMDGLQATAAIRKAEKAMADRENKKGHPTMHRVPIIAMTAHAMKDHQAICLEAGMDDFLPKPITRNRLLSMLEKWLRSSPGSPRLSESDGHLPSKAGQDEKGPTEADNGKPMDLERALEEFEGDRDVLSEVIEGFTKKVGEQIGTIRQALSCGDAETVRKEAHSIKGGGANLTAENLSRVAFKLESKGKSKELDGADEIVNGLEKELAALTRYVQENFLKHGEL